MKIVTFAVAILILYETATSTSPPRSLLSGPVCSKIIEGIDPEFKQKSCQNGNLVIDIQKETFLLKLYVQWKPKGLQPAEDGEKNQSADDGSSAVSFCLESNVEVGSHSFSNIECQDVQLTPEEETSGAPFIDIINKDIHGTVAYIENQLKHGLTLARLDAAAEAAFKLDAADIHKINLLPEEWSQNALCTRYEAPDRSLTFLSKAVFTDDTTIEWTLTDNYISHTYSINVLDAANLFEPHHYEEGQEPIIEHFQRITKELVPQFLSEIGWPNFKNSKAGTPLIQVDHLVQIVDLYLQKDFIFEKSDSCPLEIKGVTAVNPQQIFSRKKILIADEADMPDDPPKNFRGMELYDYFAYFKKPGETFSSEEMEVGALFATVNSDSLRIGSEHLVCVDDACAPGMAPEEREKISQKIVHKIHDELFATAENSRHNYAELAYYIHEENRLFFVHIYKYEGGVLPLFHLHFSTQMFQSEYLLGVDAKEILADQIHQILNFNLRHYVRMLYFSKKVKKVEMTLNLIKRNVEEILALSKFGAEGALLAACRESYQIEERNILRYWLTKSIAPSPVIKDCQLDGNLGVIFEFDEIGPEEWVFKSESTGLYSPKFKTEGVTYRFFKKFNYDYTAVMRGFIQDRVAEFTKRGFWVDGVKPDDLPEKKLKPHEAPVEVKEEGKEPKEYEGELPKPELEEQGEVHESQGNDSGQTRDNTGDEPGSSQSGGGNDDEVGSVKKPEDDQGEPVSLPNPDDQNGAGQGQPGNEIKKDLEEVGQGTGVQEEEVGSDNGQNQGVNGDEPLKIEENLGQDRKLAKNLPNPTFI